MDNENKSKVNRKKRNRDKSRAEIFANQMSELKQFLHNEINRGVNAAEVERKLNGKIDKIVTEVRNYERLEHLIDAKAKDAVSAVDKRMGIYLILFGAIISVIGIVGWKPLLNKAASLAIEKIGESDGGEDLDRLVSNARKFRAKRMGQR